MSKFFSLILLSFMAISLIGLASAAPNGANYTQETTSRASASPPQSHSAIAGNVTELTVTGTSITQSWQGYYGNVTGTIWLADSSSNVFYNWSISSPQGEIYSSTNGTSIDWTYTQCFNFTANGSYADDTGNAGGTSQFGTNLSTLEGNFNINDSDVDGVNETFTLSGAGTHDAFFTGSLSFSEGECPNTRVFTNNGLGESNFFEEALLYEPTSRAVIFTSILDEDATGFDGNLHDFEMLVLEDGHNADTSTTTYFFYVELE